MMGHDQVGTGLWRVLRGLNGEPVEILDDRVNINDGAHIYIPLIVIRTMDS